MKNPTVSIVIISYDPTAVFLRETLGILTQQDFKDFEVILVDSGEQKVSSEILANSPLIKLASSKTIPIPPVIKKDFNYAAAYNQGILKAQGKIVVRLSADAVPTDKYWLQNLITPFMVNDVVGIVFGKFTKDSTRYAIVTGIKTNFRQNLKPSSSQKLRKDDTEQAIVAQISSFPNLYRIYEKFMWQIFQPSSPRVYKSFPFVTGACFAFLKEIWEKHAFNESWSWGDEYEFALFALRQGFQVHYTPSAQIYHAHDLSFFEGLRRIFKDLFLAWKVLRLMLSKN